MTQIDIMEFLDKRPGIYYDAKDIYKALKKQISLITITKSLKKIVKREEYELRVVYINDRFRSIYTKKVEDRKNG